MSNAKYEVVVTKWSSESNCQVKVVAGEFSRFFDAKLFADAYAKHYSARPEIVEYVKKEAHGNAKCDLVAM